MNIIHTYEVTIFDKNEINTHSRKALVEPPPSIVVEPQTTPMVHVDDKVMKLLTVKTTADKEYAPYKQPIPFPSRLRHS